MKLGKLARTEDVWEAGMVYGPTPVDGAELIGLLVVVERGSGLIRVASAVTRSEPVSVVFRTAFLAPADPARPGRPQKVVVDDPRLLPQLATVLTEAQVPASAGGTAALDDAIARLLNAAGAPLAPGIDRDLATWRTALAALIRVAPWSVLSEAVEFTFVGGGLDDAVALVMGSGGKIPGIVLYATFDDLAVYRERAGEGPRAPRSSLHVMFEPRAGLTDDEYDRCLRVGLQFPPGLYPRVYSSDGNTFRIATADEQDQLLRAVRGVTALCVREQARLAGGEELSETVPLPGGGSFDVTGTPP